MCRGTTNGEDVYIIKEELIPKETMSKLNSGWIHNHGGIPVDMCIGKELEELILKGISTIGSCCGHERWQSHALVYSDELSKVHELGYLTEEYKWDMYYVHLKTGTQI